MAMRFGMAHPEVVEWIMDNAGKNFADSLGRHLNDTSRSPKARSTRSAGSSLSEPRAPGAAPLRGGDHVGHIEEAFAHARATGVKRLRMHLDTFKFSPAAESSPNKDGIYVEISADGGAYLGKFLRATECSNDEAQRIVATAVNSEHAVKAYG